MPYDRRLFADRLRFARRQRGYRSRNKFAEASGLSVGALESYETAQRVPRADTLLILVRVLNVSCDWLLGRVP